MNLRVLCFISSKIVQVNCRPGKVVPDNVFHAELNLRRKEKQKKKELEKTYRKQKMLNLIDMKALIFQWPSFFDNISPLKMLYVRKIVCTFL